MITQRGGSPACPRGRFREVKTALEPRPGNLYHVGVKSRTLSRVVVLSAMLALASVATAQTVRPPNPTSTDKPPLLTYLMAVVVGGLVIGGNLIPSKRGHQD